MLFLSPNFIKNKQTTKKKMASCAGREQTGLCFHNTKHISLSFTKT